MAPKDYVYEARDASSHLGRTEGGGGGGIVQRSGMIFERAPQIIIKNGPWVIIRA